MSQSLPHIYIHIVFSTKNRAPIITNGIKLELHSYLGAICKSLKCTPISIGGYHDHVHILCILWKEIAVTKLVEELKKRTSKWIKRRDGIFENFYWQSGYSVFSVNPSQLESVKAYIQNQEQHHSKQSYQDECRKIYKKYEISFDERYVWD